MLIIFANFAELQEGRDNFIIIREKEFNFFNFIKMEQNFPKMEQILQTLKNIEGNF